MNDKELKRMSDEELRALPLHELQRIRDKRWAWQQHELEARAQKEVERRDPRKSWSCLRCGTEKFHQREARIAGSLIASWLGLETTKYHVIVCNYCGKAEFYSVKFTGSNLVDFVSG